MRTRWLTSLVLLAVAVPVIPAGADTRKRDRGPKLQRMESVLIDIFGGGEPREELSNLRVKSGTVVKQDTEFTETPILQWTIENDATVQVPIATTLRLAYEIEGDPQQHEVWFWAPVPFPGQSVTMTHALPSVIKGDVRTYRFSVHVDHWDALAETNENDNFLLTWRRL